MFRIEVLNNKKWVGPYTLENNLMLGNYTNVLSKYHQRYEYYLKYIDDNVKSTKIDGLHWFKNIHTTGMLNYVCVVQYGKPNVRIAWLNPPFVSKIIYDDNHQVCFESCNQEKIIYFCLIFPTGIDDNF